MKNSKKSHRQQRNKLWTHLRPLTGSGGVVPNLALVIVSPSKYLAVTGAGQAVEGAARNVHHPPVRQGTHDPLGGPLVGVMAMAESEVVSLAPALE